MVFFFFFKNWKCKCFEMLEFFSQIICKFIYDALLLSLCTLSILNGFIVFSGKFNILPYFDQPLKLNIHAFLCYNIHALYCCTLLGKTIHRWHMRSSKMSLNSNKTNIQFSGAMCASYLEIYCVWWNPIKIRLEMGLVPDSVWSHRSHMCPVILKWCTCRILHVTYLEIILFMSLFMFPEQGTHQ